MDGQTDGHTYCIYFKGGILGPVKHMVVLNLGYFMQNFLTDILSNGEMLCYNLIQNIAKNDSCLKQNQI